MKRLRNYDSTKLELLQLRLKDVFKDEDFSEQCRQDLIFHLIDWIDDLYDFCSLYNNFEKKTNKEIEKTVIDFLVHVPNHLNAAKYLHGLGKGEDVFNLGILPRV